jgi:hypothetical protein
MRPAFSATGEPPLTLSLFMITCQGTTQAENRTYRFDIGPSTSTYKPVAQNEQSPP